MWKFVESLWHWQASGKEPHPLDVQYGLLQCDVKLVDKKSKTYEVSDDNFIVIRIIVTFGRSVIQNVLSINNSVLSECCEVLKREVIHWQPFYLPLLEGTLPTLLILRRTILPNFLSLYELLFEVTTRLMTIWDLSSQEVQRTVWFMDLPPWTFDFQICLWNDNTRTPNAQLSDSQPRQKHASHFN